MKRILLASAAIVSLFATNANAADLAVKAPPMVAPVVWNWTGFYIGVNGGYSWGRSNATVDPNSLFATNIGHNVDGWLGGGQIGYNWHVDPKWVLGIEADIQGTDERGGSVDTLPNVRIPNFAFSGAATSNTSLPWFATFRGRAGWLADPSLLLYVTGGLAVGEVKFNTQSAFLVQRLDGGNNPIGQPFSLVNATVFDRQTRVGWTVGAGLEKKFTPNWSGKLEYLYVDLGSATYFGGTANETGVNFHDHVFRAGINYQFTAGPIVAKY